MLPFCKAGSAVAAADGCGAATVVGGPAGRGRNRRRGTGQWLSRSRRRIAVLQDARPALAVRPDADAGRLFRGLLCHADRNRALTGQGILQPWRWRSAASVLRWTAMQSNTGVSPKETAGTHRRKRDRPYQSLPLGASGNQSVPVGTNPNSNSNPKSNPNPNSNTNPNTREGAAGKPPMERRRSGDGVSVPPDAETGKAYGQERRNRVDADTFVGTVITGKSGSAYVTRT